jgi:hypothetical protein
MQNLKYRISGLFILLLVTFFIFGCASDPVNVDLSANHPANPEAQEAEFIPPPNPFKQDVTAMKAESTPDSMMMDKTHDEKNQKHMHHNDNQHGGHSQ